MKKSPEIALIAAGSCVAAAGLFLGWSANYAGASYFVLKSAAMAKAFFGGDLLMPAKQLFAYFGDARLSKVAKMATAATAVESAAIGAAAFLLIARPWQVRPPADGSRLATLKDLGEAGLLDGKPGSSVLLGTFGKGRQAREVRYSGDSHFFVNGPSRSGKGRGFVMTNLLEYQGSVIVLDVKLENWEKTGPARLAMGQKCFVFAPGATMSHRWNPLDFVRDWPERSTDLINLSASLIPLGDKEEPHWKQTARGLFAGVLGYVLESKTMEGRRTLRSALRMFSTGKPFSAVVDKILKEEPDLNDFILGSFRQHLGRDEEQRPSFEGHITTSLSPLNNLLMAEATSASDFDIRELRRNPFSLFIASPVSDFGTVEPIIRLLIQQIHDVMLRKLPGKDEPYKILMMLDEFYQFERLPEIIKRAPLVAGYGMTIALVAQNIPQIDERYGVKTRDALIGNMDIQLYIAVGDDTTAKIVSDNLGKYYVEREGWGKSGGLLMGRQASQGRFELMPLMLPDSVRRLDDRSTILQIRGSYSAILNKLNFYEDRQFVDRRAKVAAHGGSLPQPAVTPTEEWPLFQAKPASCSASEPAVSSQQAGGNGSGRGGLEQQHGSSLDDDATFIQMLANKVYHKSDHFMQAYRVAVAALDNGVAAQMLYLLRMTPDQYGPLLGADRGLNMQARLARKRAFAEIAPLREAIIRSRRKIINQRASHFVAQTGLSVVKAMEQPQSSPVTIGLAEPASIVPASPENAALAPSGLLVPAEAAISAAPQTSVFAPDAGPFAETPGAFEDDVFGNRVLADDPAHAEVPVASVLEADEPAEDEDDFRIDFGLSEAAGNVVALELIAQAETTSGRALNITALRGALTRMRSGLEGATSDDNWSAASVFQAF